MLTALGRTLRGEADAPAALFGRQRGLSGGQKGKYPRARRLFWWAAQVHHSDWQSCSDSFSGLGGSTLCSNLEGRCLLACRHSMVASTRLTSQNTPAVHG